jgi:hypothetical protein
VKSIWVKSPWVRSIWLSRLWVKIIWEWFSKRKHEDVELKMIESIYIRSIKLSQGIFSANHGIDKIRGEWKWILPRIMETSMDSSGIFPWTILWLNSPLKPRFSSWFSGDSL